MVPTGMTNYDIQNYLEKIYKIKIIKVESNIENGKILFILYNYKYLKQMYRYYIHYYDMF